LIKKNMFKEVLLSVVMTCWMISTPVCAADMGLVDLLSSQLGVTKGQAEGGAGSIFQMAKQNLSIEDFSIVAKSVPGIDKMMDMVPKAGTSSSTLGNISSMMGGSSGSIKGLAGLSSSFTQLGMSGDMVGKFVPIILDYVKNKGGDHAMNLLKGALQ